MTIKLGSNIDSLAAQSALNQFTSSLTKSYQRLSSGLRINQASDDAAGLSIVSQLNSHARVFTQAIRNVNDGVSAASIAEGALNALKTISQRQLELSEEAANGTYSIKQRGALNTEANALVDEYNRIVSTTTFNGLSLLDPSLGTVLIQAGYGQTGALQLQLSSQLKRAAGDGTFAPVQTSAVGLNVAGITTGDFNGDGIIDLVAANNGYAAVALGNGNGTFQAAFDASTGNLGGSVATGDFNGDGKLDFVSVGTYGDTDVFLGNGNGTFQAAKTLTPGGIVSWPNPSGVADWASVADLNGDGIADIVTLNDRNLVNKIEVFIGNGNGTFQAANTLLGPSVATPDGFTLGDFNGDGKMDIAASLYGSGTGILLGNGNGTFQALQSFATGDGSADSSLVAGDFNGDGNLDLIATDYDGIANILLGNGNGTFKNASSLAMEPKTYSGVVADFNNDGYLDFVDQSLFGSDILLGNGDGTFQHFQTTLGNDGFGLAAADVTGDGVTDILAAVDTGVEIFSGNTKQTSTSQHLNINTQQGARDAFNTVTANLNRIEAQLGAIGATTSRFQVELGNLQTETENFDAAAGRIQDTDVAQETANLTRTQILQQAATSVLAQANQEPRLALTLLGGG